MKILLLSPELFLADGGIARIMRLYLKALCAICGPAGRVDSLVLNDQPGRDSRLARYASERLGEHLGCAGRKLRFIAQAIRLARRADILVCGHLHHLAIARLAKFFNPRLEYYLIAHGIEVWRPYSWPERRALLGARRILCVSEYTRRQVLRFHPALPPERVIVVPNALVQHLQRERAVLPRAQQVHELQVQNLGAILLAVLKELLRGHRWGCNRDAVRARATVPHFGRKVALNQSSSMRRS